MDVSLSRIGIPGRWGKKGIVAPTFTPGPMRAWRVRLFNYNGANCGLSGVEFRATAGGAAQTGGTAIASGSFSGSFLPANAFDANLSTFWAAPGAGGGEWVGMDYGAGQTRTVNQVALISRNDIAQWPDIAIVESSIDANTWTHEWAVVPTGLAGAGQTVVLDRPIQTPALHRHWRVRATSNNGSAQVAIGEVQLLDQAGRVWGQLYGGTARSGGDFSGTFSSDKAFDWNSGTTWAAPGNTGWVGYTPGQPIAVGQLRMMAGSGSNGFVVGQMPKDFVIESSDDVGTPVDWITEWSVANQTAWSLNESRLFTRV